MAKSTVREKVKDVTEKASAFKERDPGQAAKVTAVVSAAAGAFSPAVGAVGFAIALSQANEAGRRLITADAEKVPAELSAGEAHAKVGQRLRAGFTGEARVQEKEVIKASKEAQSLLVAAEVLEHIASLSPEEQRAALQEIILESGDTPHNADVALWALNEAMAEQYRLGAGTEKERAQRAVLAVAEMQGGYLEIESARQERERDGELTERDEKQIALSKQEAALEDLQTALGAISGEIGSTGKLRTAAMRSKWKRGLGGGLREHAQDVVQRMRASGDYKGKVVELGWGVKSLAETTWDSIKAASERFDAGEREAILEKRREHALTMLGWAQADIEGKNEGRHLAVESNLADFYEGALVVGMDEEGQLTMTAQDLTAESEGRQGYLLGLAASLAEDKYADAQNIIARYHEEYEGFLQYHSGVREVGRSPEEIEGEIRQANPVLFRAHRDYQVLHEAMLGLAPREGSREARAPAIKVLEAEIASLDSTSRQGRALMTALDSLKAGNSSAAYPILAKRLADTAVREEEYQQAMESRRLDSLTEVDLTEREVYQQLPPEYHEAIATRDRYVPVIRMAQQVRERASDPWEASLTESEAGEVIAVLEQERDGLLDGEHITAAQARIDLLKNKNVQMAMELGKLRDRLEGASTDSLAAELTEIHDEIRVDLRETREELGELDPTSELEKEVRALVQQKKDCLARAADLDCMAGNMGLQAARIQAEISKVYGGKFLGDAQLSALSLREAQRAQNNMQRAVESVIGGGDVEGMTRKTGDWAREQEARLRDQESLTGAQMLESIGSLLNMMGVGMEAGDVLKEVQGRTSAEGFGFYTFLFLLFEALAQIGEN